MQRTIAISGLLLLVVTTAFADADCRKRCSYNLERDLRQCQQASVGEELRRCIDRAHERVIACARGCG